MDLDNDNGSERFAAAVAVDAVELVEVVEAVECIAQEAVASTERAHAEAANADIAYTEEAANFGTFANS